VKATTAQVIAMAEKKRMILTAELDGSHTDCGFVSCFGPLMFKSRDSAGEEGVRRREEKEQMKKIETAIRHA